MSGSACVPMRSSAGQPERLLRVEDLVVEFTVPRGQLRAVDGVSFEVGPGEIVGLVGESGCGKTVTMSAILGLLPGGGRITGGSISFGELDLTSAPEKEYARIRGSSLALVPPDPSAALNPVVRIGPQAEAGLRAHRQDLGKAERRQLLRDTFVTLGLDDVDAIARRFPHQLSGGMQQRVIIAMALLTRPALIIADEPTTALDVTTQRQVIRLLDGIRTDFGTSVVFVTHDIALLSQIADRIVVMYAGQVVETGAAADILHRPAHPYTRALIASIPPLAARPDGQRAARPDDQRAARPDGQRAGRPAGRLAAIEGLPPDPPPWPDGCRFAPRCTLRESVADPDRCVSQLPALRARAGGSLSACHFSEMLEVTQP
jgi:ABC-type dipeptide/oligopeptide/nickel transport system ATPase component